MVEKGSPKRPGEEGWDASAVCIAPSSEQLGAALALARPGLDPFPAKGVGHLGFRVQAEGSIAVGQMMALLAPVSVARP